MDVLDVPTDGPVDRPIPNLTLYFWTICGGRRRTLIFGPNSIGMDGMKKIWKTWDVFRPQYVSEADREEAMHGWLTDIINISATILRFFVNIGRQLSVEIGLRAENGQENVDSAAALVSVGAFFAPKCLKSSHVRSSPIYQIIARRIWAEEKERQFLGR